MCQNSVSIDGAVESGRQCHKLRMEHRRLHGSLNMNSIKGLINLQSKDKT